jgi:hypothetical protein
MRPYCKGYLKLALVSCPIALHAACSSAERTGSAGHAGATANLKLTFHLDHSAGAVHLAA